MAIIHTAPSNWLCITKCTDDECMACKTIAENTTATKINTVKDLVNFMRENENKNLVLISKTTYNYIKDKIK